MKPSKPACLKISQVVPLSAVCPGGITSPSGIVICMPLPQTEHTGKPGLGGRTIVGTGANVGS